MTVTCKFEDLVSDTRLAESFYSRYDVENILGSGASSTVRRCIEKDTKSEYAVKILDLNSGVDDPDVIRSECMREVAILRRVSGHVNIAKLHDVFEGDAYVFLVSELCYGGELFDFLTQNVTLSEKRTRSLMRQLIDGVSFIHKHEVVHRDLKPENILLDENLNIKITDFGLAVLIDDEAELKETRGTPGYLAPEVLKCGYYNDQPPYGQPVDIWACGVIMYTLLVGFPPFWNRKEHLMLRQIMEGRFNFPSPEWDDISEAAKDLIRKLLVIDSVARLTANQALQHEFFMQQNNEFLIKLLTQPFHPSKSFGARRKFNVGIIAVKFIYRLKRLKSDAAYLDIEQLIIDPYANRKLRKIIDTLSYDIYSQWIKKGEEQNRAALFENTPRRDLIGRFGQENSYNNYNWSESEMDQLNRNDNRYDEDDEFRMPIRVEY